MPPLCGPTFAKPQPDGVQAAAQSGGQRPPWLLGTWNEARAAEGINFHFTYTNVNLKTDTDQLLKSFPKVWNSLRM